MESKIQALWNRYQKEREFRYFLLHALEMPKQDSELLSTISSLPQKIKQNKLLSILKKQSNPISKEPPNTGDQQRILLSLMPREFQDLKDEIQNIKVQPELFHHMFRYLSYHSILQKQNEILQAQVKILKMSLSSPPHTPKPLESESILFPQPIGVERKEQKLKSLIQSRRNDIKYLQKEIDKLQRQYDLLKKEENEKLSEEQNQEGNLCLILDSKRKDLKELKEKINEETQENILLKQKLNQ